MNDKSFVHLCSIVLFWFCQFSYAAAFNAGDKLQPISISDLGECVLVGDKTEFQAWQLQAKSGLHIIEHVAARAGVDKINQTFFSALDDSKYAALNIPVTRVVNADDALWGTSGLVAGEIRKSKQQYPEDTFIVDAEGVGQKTWGLQKKTAALIIVDKDGSVLFFNEGPLNSDQLNKALSVIQSLLTLAGNGSIE